METKINLSKLDAQKYRDARIQRNRQQLSRRAPFWRIGLMLGSLLFVGAFTLDVQLFKKRGPVPEKTANVGDQLINVLTTQRRHLDPQGRFSVAWPEGWTLQTGADVAPRDAFLFIPNFMELSIQITKVDYIDLAVLEARLKGKEAQFDADTHMEKIDFKGQPAIQRTCRIHTEKLYMLDFLENGYEYHLMVSVPPEKFDSYLPLIKELLNTFEVLPTKS